MVIAVADKQTIERKLAGPMKPQHSETDQESSEEEEEEDDEDEAEEEEEEEEDQEDPEEEDQEQAEEDMEEAIEEAIAVESLTKFGGVEDELDCQRPEVHDPQVLADAMSGSRPTFSTAPPLQDEDDGDAVRASTQGRTSVTSRVTFGDPGAGCHPDRTLPRPGSQESRCYTSFTRTGSGSRSEGGRSTPEGTGSDWIRRTTLAAMSGALRTNSSTSSLQRADTPEPEMSTFSVPPREPRFPSGRTRVVSATVYSYPFAKRPTESKTARSVESGGQVSPVGSEQNPRTLPAAARQLEKRCATVTGSPQHVTAKMHTAPESRARSMGAESAKVAESAGSFGKAGRGVAARPLQPATGPGGFAVGSSWRNLSDGGKRRPSTASAASARASSTGPGEASPREMRATAKSADGPSRPLAGQRSARSEREAERRRPPSGFSFQKETRLEACHRRSSRCHDLQGWVGNL
eukprot:s24_g15.t1